jgi:hypothetical protein
MTVKSSYGDFFKVKYSNFTKFTTYCSQSETMNVIDRFKNIRNKCLNYFFIIGDISISKDYASILTSYIFYLTFCIPLYSPSTINICYMFKIFFFFFFFF